MLESVLVFAMKCLWGLIYAGFLVGVFVLAVWLLALVVCILSGRDNTRYRFPFW